MRNGRYAAEVMSEVKWVKLRSRGKPDLGSRLHFGFLPLSKNNSAASHLRWDQRPTGTIFTDLMSVDPTPSVSANSKVRISSEIGAKPSRLRRWSRRAR